MSRIDRFLYTADWAEGFINISQKRLTRLNSDHFLVSLTLFFYIRGKFFNIIFL
jgi:hypothetical protein